MVSPVECFSGDGPIVSVKLLYKPKDDVSVWSSIVGTWLSEWVPGSCEEPGVCRGLHLAQKDPSVVTLVGHW